MCSQLAIANGFCGRVRMYSCRCCVKKALLRKGRRGLYLRLIANEINLLVNVRIWATLHDRVPSMNASRLLRGGPSLSRGDVLLPNIGAREPESLHNFCVGVTNLLSTEFFRFVRQLGYDVIALGTPSAA